MYGINELEIIRQYTEQLREVEKNYHMFRQSQTESQNVRKIGYWRNMMSFFKGRFDSHQNVTIQKHTVDIKMQDNQKSQLALRQVVIHPK